VDGLEVIVYAPWYPALDQVQYDLQTSGLCFPVVHAEKSIGPAFGSDSKQERRECAVDFWKRGRQGGRWDVE